MFSGVDLVNDYRRFGEDHCPDMQGKVFPTHRLLYPEDGGYTLLRNAHKY